jgi:tricorn protease
MKRRQSVVMIAAGMVMAGLWAMPPVSGQRAGDVPRRCRAFAEPAISPDRGEIAFVSGGDIWTVPAAGGEARLLVAHEATESRPLYSPDGTRLAFTSDRTGGGDIYILTFATGALNS